MDGEATVPYYNHAHITQPVTRTPELREVLREGARSAVGWYGDGVVPRYVVGRRHAKARVAEPLRSNALCMRRIVVSVRAALWPDLSPAW